LLFKINPAYGTNLHDLRLSPDIKIEDHKLIDEGMRKVYNSGKCFINPSLAEGFNMTLLEAMACGLDIISTVNGGQMEYLTKISSEDRGYLLLHGDVIPAKYTMWDTSKWVRPNMEELRQTMRMFYDRKTTFAKRTHKNIEEFTWDNAAKKATACLEE
jgi:glycosyltransferase involved in cell wall biosynthesis